MKESILKSSALIALLSTILLFAGCDSNLAYDNDSEDAVSLSEFIFSSKKNTAAFGINGNFEIGKFFKCISLSPVSVTAEYYFKVTGERTAMLYAVDNGKFIWETERNVDWNNYIKCGPFFYNHAEKYAAQKISGTEGELEGRWKFRKRGLAAFSSNGNGLVTFFDNGETVPYMKVGDYVEFKTMESTGGGYPVEIKNHLVQVGNNLYETDQYLEPVYGIPMWYIEAGK